ncbi:MAG TPA: SCO2521 family protein [Amycolatopsis sp.]|nr:SCO2521 family protein [Amycolatopsis sp.]
MVILGEIRTCLLHNSRPLPKAVVTELLGLKPGRRVRVSDRPVNLSVSPELTVGVDCRLASEPVVKTRGIGTVVSRAMVTGGVVLQASAGATLSPAASDTRQGWSHYARRIGVVEVIGKADAGQLALGHRTTGSGGGTLDLGAIGEHLLDVVQMRPQLDHTTAIRARTTRVRWSARCVAGDRSEPAVRLHVEDEVVRTIELVVTAEQLGAVQRFCEDVALHDWLLTTLGNTIDQVARGDDDRIDVLASAVERVVHLWMPGAHVDPAMQVLWDKLERQPGFSRQWGAQVAQIRDLVALRTLKALEEARRRETADW